MFKFKQFIILILCFFLYVIGGLSQNASDSMEENLDTLLKNGIIELGNDQCATAKEKFNRVIERADQLNNSIAEYSARYRLSQAYLFCDFDFIRAYDQSYLTLELAKKLKNYEYISLSNNLLGAFSYELGDYNSACEFYEETINSGTFIIDDESKLQMLGIGYINLCDAKIRLAEESQDRDTSIQLYHEADSLLKSTEILFKTVEINTDDSRILKRLKVYWHIYKGTIACELKSNEETGLAFLTKATRMALAEDLKGDLDDTSFYCGKCLNTMGRYAEAVDSLRSGLKILNKNKSTEIGIYEELGIAYKNVDSVEQALYFISKAYNVFEGDVKIRGQQFYTFTRKRSENDFKVLKAENHSNRIVIFFFGALTLLCLWIIWRKNKNSIIYRKLNEKLKEALLAEQTLLKEKASANAQLDESNQKLNETLIAKQTFISILAHQSKGRVDTLKNQVNAFKNKVYPVLERPRKGDLDLMQEFIFRLSNTFHNLLVWARPIAGIDLPMNKQKLNLKTEFGGISEFNKEIKREGNLHDIEVFFDFPLEHNIFSDRVFTTVILRNVLENAVKYSKGKNIFISSLEEDDETLIVIEDDGVGVPTEKLNDEIFEFDAPLDDDQRASGFGLKICNKLARQQGGRLSIKPRKNGGTIVTLICDKFIEK